MIILTIRTDNPEAEIGLYDGHTQLAYETWSAHRQLGVTIHTKIKRLLDGQGKTWQSLEGIVVFAGPGSFTGLRIGIAVANGLAQGLSVPVAGVMNPGWRETGVQKLIRGENDVVIVPQYGAPVHITLQKR